MQAAHCVYDKGSFSPTSAEDIKVLLGAYNISMKSEKYKKEFQVAGIIIHNNWDPDDYIRYSHDIAILKFWSLC